MPQGLPSYQMGSRVPEGRAMRIKAVHRSRGRGPARTGGGPAAVLVGAVVCAVSLAACGSTPAPGAAPAAGSAPATAGGSATPSAPAASSTPSPAATAANTPGTSADSACAASALKVGLTNTGALGGQAGGYLRFTNDGTTACRMDGWPVVVAVTAAGKVTTLRHAQSTMYGAWQAPASLPVVMLPPGGSAYAVVAGDDQPAGNAARCPAPYVRLRVSAPGTSASVAVSAWLPGAGSYLPSCPSITGSPTGEVSAITPLSSLPH
jgi:Protein of unknown function (DUF4232)